MSKTQAGREAWALICFVVAPALPPVTTKTKIKEAAYAAFNVGDGFPQSRIDEAAQERCGWPTKAAIEDRARQLGLRLPESPWKRRGFGSSERLLENLRAAQATLYTRHQDPRHPEIIALAEAIDQLAGTQ